MKPSMQADRCARYLHIARMPTFNDLVRVSHSTDWQAAALSRWMQTQSPPTLQRADKARE